MELLDELLEELLDELPVLGVLEAGVEAEAGGIFNSCPTVSEFGSARLLALASAAVVTPCELAIAPSVSPALTVYVPALELPLLVVPEGRAVVAAAAGVDAPGGKVATTDAGVLAAPDDVAPLPGVPPAAAVELAVADAPAPAVELAVAEPVGEPVGDPDGDGIGVIVVNVEGKALDVGNGVAGVLGLLQAIAATKQSAGGRTSAARPNLRSLFMLIISSPVYRLRAVRPSPVVHPE